MWKNINGRLVQTKDTSRVKFRTTISKSILDQLKEIAKENDTSVNYLFENGLERVISSGIITFNKDTRPKDRILYMTSYDKDLLNKVKEFAKNHKLYINDVIEYAVQFIDLDQVKRGDYRYRIE